MPRSDDVPEFNNRSITRTDLIGVAWRYIAIICTVNEQYRDTCANHRLLRRSRFHVYAVSKTDIEKSNVNRGVKECPAKPRTGVERLTEAGVSDLAERREWRFSNHSTETVFRS